MLAIFGGRLHDVLWRDCALRFVQSLGKGWIADGVGMASKVIMVKSNGASCTSVLDAVQMDLTLENRSNVVFAFGPEQGVMEVPVDKQAPSVDPGSHNVLFASLLRTVPKDMKVLKGSTKVTDDSAAIVISQLHPVELRKTGDRSGVVRLSLERQGIGDREALVLTANTFETESLLNMLCWDNAPINHYDFGRFVPEDLRTAMPPVMAGLIDSLGDEDSCYRADEDALTVLRYLESMGFVARLPEHRGSNSWRITREGLASLNVSAWLSNPVRIFKARADVEDSELQCLEVHFRLAEAGWVCQVGQKAAKPTPYIKGGPKVLWLQTGQMSFCQPYLLCLLKVMEGSLDKEVPHFQQVKVYNSLLSGKEYVKKSRVSFAFGASSPRVPPAKRPRVARSASKSRAPASGSDRDGSSSSSPSDDSSSSSSSSPSSVESAAATSSVASAGAPLESSDSSSTSRQRCKTKTYIYIYIYICV